jgi:hypothetical protein
MSDDEGYDFEYSGSEEGQEESGPTVEAQNLYYSAKNLCTDSNPRQCDFATARAKFEELLALESKHPEISDWGFKAIKRLTKISIAQGDFAEGLRNFK